MPWTSAIEVIMSASSREPRILKRPDLVALQPRTDERMFGDQSLPANGNRRSAHEARADQSLVKYFLCFSQLASARATI